MRGRVCFSTPSASVAPSAALTILALSAAWLLGPRSASAQFAPPEGGWAYCYQANAGEDASGANFTSLDGTWNHDNGSDEWDGSAIGAGRPGGVVVLADGDDSYLRLQETGDPGDHGMGDPGSNRKLYFGHDIGPDGGTATVLDSGATLNFKIRVPTGEGLDDLHPDGGGAISPYPAGGDGYSLHNGGKGGIGINQSSGGLVSFSLGFDEDTAGSGAGLLMNNLNGVAVSGDVDPGDGGTVNVLAVDPVQWQDVWVTIQAGGAGTHVVTVYLNGDLAPAGQFDVTAGDGSDFSNISYIAMGLGATSLSGALDVDFLCFAPGVHAPLPSLVAHLPLDGTLDDASGNGNVGTFFGGDMPVFVEGFDGTPGGAVAFDGVDDYVSLTQAIGLPVTNGPAFTIAMWVNGPVQRDRRVFSEGSTSSNNPLFNLGTHNGGGNGAFNSFLRPGPGHRQTAFEPFDESWHHVAWVDRNGRVDVYIDGVRDPVNMNYARVQRALDTTAIGGILRAGPCCYFTGAIDDVRIYNNALTEADVQALIPTPQCPAEGDTRCSDLAVDHDGFGGVTLTAMGSDGDGDTPIYTFTVSDDDGIVFQAGPQDSNTAQFHLGTGNWMLAVTVDDDLGCFDRADSDTCTRDFEVTPPPPQKIGGWNFNGDLLDSTGHENHGAFFGGDAPNFVEGFDGTPGGAIEFDGMDDYVRVDQNLGLPIYNNEAYTVSLWVKGGPQRDFRVFSEASTSNRNPLFNVGTDNTGNTGKMDIFIRLGDTLVGHSKSDREPFDSNWHHIAWVDDNGTGKMYVDGVPEPGTVDYTRPASVSLDTTTIGGILRDTPSHWFIGAIDEVCVFNYALTAGEIRDLIPPGLPGCGNDMDTACTDLMVTGPAARTEGIYTLEMAATDISGDDPLVYLFRATNQEGLEIQIGPQTAKTAEVSLTPGMWTITGTVDDALLCRDDGPGATCTPVEVEVLAEPEIQISGWSFDGNLLDSEPAGNDGEFLGGDPGYVFGHDCASPGAIQFDGADDLVRVATMDGLPVTGRSAFTIAMWVKGMAQNDRRIFSESNTQGNNNTLFNLGTDNTGDTGALDFFYRDDSGSVIASHVKSTGTVFDGAWHHVAWVDSRGQVVLYIDGQPDATDFSYTRGTLTVDTTTIGGILRGSPCCLFDGAIDDVMIFNYALAQAEVATLVGDGAREDCCPVEGEPEFGDTQCTGIEVAGPAGDGPGDYTVTATAADGTSDPIQYTFMADDLTDGPGNPVVIGPRPENSATFTLDLGPWSLSVTVDDDPDCDDPADNTACVREITVVAPGGGQIPGDCTNDGVLNIGDPICVFGVLFQGNPSRFPCGTGTSNDAASMQLLDWQPDGRIDITDGIDALQFLFLGGPPHTLGQSCVRIVDCPQICNP